MLALVMTPTAQPDERAMPTGIANPTLQEAILNINTDDIALLEQWTEGGLQEMATPTTRSRGTTIPVSRSTPGLVT